jgi:hypothetical protein
MTNISKARFSYSLSIAGSSGLNYTEVLVDPNQYLNGTLFFRKAHT